MVLTYQILLLVIKNNKNTFSQICISNLKIEIELLWQCTSVSRLCKKLLPLLVVHPLPVHQFLVSSLFLNSTLTDDHNLICPLNGLQPVSDYQKGLAGTTRQSFLNL